MSMKIYVVRHGQTVENFAEIIQGHQPGVLTELGHAQAQRVAERLREVSFDAIYASDLGRVVQTARYIATHHTVPVVYDPLLRERGAGIYEGLPRRDLWQAEAESGQPIVDFRPEGGESFRDLQERIEQFLRRLRQEAAGKTVLLVSHGGWNRQLLGQMMGYSIEESLPIVQVNTCVNLLDCPEDGPVSIELINCVRHLEVEPRLLPPPSD
jgi:broad specificity phosphatase PhoE